jgi:hypothetical protein
MAITQPADQRKLNEHRVGRREGLDEQPADARAGDLADRLAALQLGVAFDQQLPVDELGQVGLVGHVEEHGADAGAERDHIQLPDGQDPQELRERDRSQQRRAEQVVDNEHPAEPHPVHPRAGRQPDDQERGRLARGQQADLERRRVHHEDRDQRQGQLADHRAELADRLADPQPPEFAVMPQPAAPPGRAGRASRADRAGRAGIRFRVSHGDHRG